MAVLGGGWRFLMSEVPVTARVEVLTIKRRQVLLLGEEGATIKDFNLKDRP